MTRAAEQVDEKSIEHLDFAVLCRVRFAVFAISSLGHVMVVSKGPICEEPAIARMVCNICGSDMLICASHRSAIASDPSSFCHRCKTRAAGAVLFRFEPIGGA